MEVYIDIKYNARSKYYHLVVKDDKQNPIPYVAARVYESHSDARIASGIMEFMFDKIDKVEQFDINEFDYCIRTTLRLIDSPNKW